MVNRLDNVFIFGIPLLYEFWREKNWRLRGFLIVGCTPIVAWLLFSLVYYGSLLSNSAIAKLNTGIPRLEYVQHGLLYFWDALLFDTLTLVGTILGVVAAFARRSRNFVSRGRNFAPLAVGAVLFLLYVIWVGGDFMRGRFLTVPLFLSLAILLRTDFCVSTRFRHWLPLAVVVISLPSLDRAILGRPLDEAREQEGLLRTGISDERWQYLDAGLTRGQLALQIGHNMGRMRSLRAADPTRIRVVNSSGRGGFAAGPEPYIIDSFSLTNPLLSRLEVRKDRKWRIGHFERLVPEGYLTTLVTNESAFSNPEIGDLYRRIETVTRGRLFNVERWKNIWRLNNPFTKTVHALPQEVFISHTECATLAATHLDILDSQFLWGAARVRLVEGDAESTKRILKRLFWMERVTGRDLVSHVDYVTEAIGAAQQLSTTHSSEAELLLKLTIEEVPHRKEPLLALAELYDSMHRTDEAAKIRQRAAPRSR